MDDGPLKAKYLTADGAGKIAQRAMRALDRTRVKGFNSNGVDMLLALRLRSSDRVKWKVAFDDFFTAWTAEIIRQNVVEDYAASTDQLREGDFNTLTWDAIRKAKGNIRDDLWNNDFITSHIRDDKPIKFGGLLVNILERQLRWAVPSTLLEIGRESVFRLFKANRARREILSDLSTPTLIKDSIEKLFEEVTAKIGVNEPKEKNNLWLDMVRYDRACGNGLEIGTKLSAMDFFDFRPIDPEQGDNFGVEDGQDKVVREKKKEILFDEEFRRTIRNNLQLSNHPETINVVVEFLRDCLKLLRSGDKMAYISIKEFLSSDEKSPPETGLTGPHLIDALRRLRACIANKLVTDPAGPNRGEKK